MLILYIVLRLFEPGLYCETEYDSSEYRSMTFRGVIQDRYLKIRDTGEFSLVAELAEADGIPEGWCILVCIDGDLAALSELEKELFRGKHVLAEGTVRLFRAATNPGEFDQRRYHSMKRHAFALYDSSIAETVPGESVSFRKAPVLRISEQMRRFRIYCRGILFANLDQREAGTAGAMLLGEKGLLTSDTKTLYRDSGIIHILAISGLHVSLIGSGLFSFLTGRKKIPGLPAARGMGVKSAAVISAAVMILYGVMTGFGISVFRAVLMFVIRQMARIRHRTYDMLSALSLAAILVLITEPYCIFDTSFVFSFGAVTAIAVSAELFRKSLSKSLFFWLFMLPLFIRSSYVFPPYSILLNLVILPVMELMIPSLMILVAAGAILPGSPAAGLPTLWVRMILYFIDTLSGASGGLPGSTFIAGRPSLPRIAGYYACLALSVYLFCGKKRSGSLKRKLQAVLPLIGGLLILLVRIHTGLDICMLDVGQGDGILIRCGSGTFLLDGGSSSDDALYEYRLYPCLSYYGVRSIDMLMISHEDYDHLSASYALIAEGRIRVKRLCLPGIRQAERGEWYHRLEALAKERGIPVVYLARGDVLARDPSFGTAGLKLAVLHPVRGGAYADANEASLTFLLSYGEFDALFTGDLEGTQEMSAVSAMSAASDIAAAAVMRELAGTKGTAGIDVLKVAHHGSRYSTSEAFLDIVRPRLSIISAGRGNAYGHPHAETLERLETAGSGILCTKDCGAIRIRAFPGGGFMVYNGAYGTGKE